MAGTNALFTLEKLYDVITSLTSSTSFCIAYSGGIDSHALLHAMVLLMSRQQVRQVRALHINHRINPKANEWERYCQRVCEKLKISFHVERVISIVRPSSSVEAVARKARYTLFQQNLRENEILLTAHTQSDQAETFLLQLLRGSGVKGLSAMPAKRKLGKGYLVRPLLEITHDNLIKYAKKNHLQWIEDDTNSELRFDRNYLRHEVLPILYHRWPRVFSVIARSAVHCAEAELLLDQLAENDLQQIQRENTLVIVPLLQLPPERQRNVLRRWISCYGFHLPQTKQLEQIRNEVLLASPDATPIFSSSEIEIRRYNGMLFLLSPLLPHETAHIIHWDFEQPLALPNALGSLIAEKQRGNGIKATIDIRKVTVRFRQGGERCRPDGRKEVHTLKKLMQEWKIPVWQRNRIPLIYYNNILIAVVGYCICEGFLAKEKEWGWDFWHKYPKKSELAHFS